MMEHMTEASECWRQYRATRAETAGSFITMGQRLAKARTTTPHGEWLPALKRAGIPVRAAQRAMKLANAGVEMRHVTHLGIGCCLELLAGGNDVEPFSGAQVNLIGEIVVYLSPDGVDGEVDEGRERNVLNWLTECISGLDAMAKLRKLRDVASVPELRTEAVLTELTAALRAVERLRWPAFPWLPLGVLSHQKI